MSSKRQPTIRDIARALDIHYTTVGKALNNHPGISAPMKERVRQMAAQMGYRPNPLVSALMAHKRMTSAHQGLGVIALVLENPAMPRDSAVRETEAGMHERAQSLGYSLQEFYLSDYDFKLSALLHALYHRGIVSLLFTATRSLLVEANEDQFQPFGAVSVCGRHGRIPAIMVDYFRSMELTCAHIRQAGYRRPGLIIASSLEPSGMERTVAAFSYFAQTRFEGAAIPVLREDDLSAEGLESWLNQYQPDFVIESWRGIRTVQGPAQWTQNSPGGHSGQHWSVSPGQLERVRELLLPLPSCILDCTSPGEVGICQNRGMVGRKAIDLLVAAQHRNEYGLPRQSHVVQVEGSWQGTLPQRV